MKKVMIISALLVVCFTQNGFCGVIAKNIGEVVGTAVGAMVGSAAEGVGDGVNMALGGVKDSEVHTDVTVRGDVTNYAGGENSDAMLAIGTASGLDNTDAYIDVNVSGNITNYAGGEDASAITRIGSVGRY